MSVGVFVTRKEARDETFILIFESIFNNATSKEILELAKEVRDLVPDEYVEGVFFGVCEKVEELDRIIEEKAIGWKLSRISKTSLAILRLAIFEIKYMDEIPVSVSINEAVELCKKYATKDDASFVNGLLSSVVKA